jgi:hypothetical protein
LRNSGRCETNNAEINTTKKHAKSVLILWGPLQNSRAFVRIVDDKILDFVYNDGKIFDTQSNSEWSYDGFAISGKYEGSQLNRMPIEPGFWFAWVAFHPDTLVFGDE